MNADNLNVRELFDVSGRTAVITGGSGGLGSAIARGLADAGMKVAVLSRRGEMCERVAADIRSAGGEAIGVSCDVSSRTSLEQAGETVAAEFGKVDVLVNGAGGSDPRAATDSEHAFFDLDTKALERVLDVNLTGTMRACQVFGRDMAKRGEGCIINIASLTSFRPLSRVSAYAAAKAGIVNFTQWLATHMAQEYSPRIRVNAIAPGFFLTELNRYLLIDAKTGDLSPRGRAAVEHTPMGRMGTPDELVGTLLWLVSPASAFVTGVTVPVDGGFCAYAGV